MGTFSKEETLPILFLPSFSMGVLFKRKKFAPLEQILSFKLDLIIKGLYWSGKQTGILKKNVSL